MPYYVDNTDLDFPLEWDFEPDFPMSDYRPFLKGEPLNSAQVDSFPEKIVVTNRKNPQEMPGVIANGADIGIVNAEVKAYLEKHDPGLHRYFPLSVHLVGTKHHLEYFYFYSDNHIDSICYEKTVFLKGTGKEAAKKSAFFMEESIDGDIECYLYKDRVGECSVWRNPIADSPFCIFFSDEFVAFLKSRNIRGWELYKCKWEK